MIGRKTVVGMALLSALVFCAFAAQSASAVTAGRTAFTCVKTEGGAGFKDAHCKEAVGSGASFKHAEIAAGTVTNTHITNDKTSTNTLEHTPGVLHAEFLGVQNEVICTKVFGHNKLVNVLEGKEHYILGSETTLHYTECKVAKPAGCVIPKETLLVKGVSATTKGQAGGTNIQFKPEVGNEFVTITYEKCTNPFLNGAHVVEGSVKGQMNGATIEFNRETTTKEGTLKFAGSAAGIEGKVTVSQAEKTAELEKTPGATGNPISSTQVNT